MFLRSYDSSGTVVLLFRRNVASNLPLRAILECRAVDANYL